MKGSVYLTLGAAALIGIGAYALRPPAAPSPGAKPPASESAPAPVAALPAAATEKIQTNAEASAPAPTTAATSPAESAAKPASPYARIRIPAGQPVPELFPGQAERDTVMALVTSDQPVSARIAAIAPYLRSANASVRSTAVDGLSQLGDKAAIPVLVEAEKNTTAPEEKERINEVIEFLGLPSFLDIVLPNTASQAANQPAP